MAGPSILVKFLGDLSGLGGAIGSAGAKAEGVAGKMHTTFSSALSALNQTGVLGPFGAALDGVDRGLQQISQHGKDVGLAMIGVGGAVAGIGVGLSALGSKEQAAHQQLQASIEATGKSYDDYSGQIDKAVAAQERYGHSSAETQDALRILTQATHDPQKALNDIGVASDLAAAKHESLASAAGQLGKAYNGSTRLLKQFGVEALPTAAKATDALAKAQAGASSANEALTKAQLHLNDVQTSGHASASQLALAQMAVHDAAAKAEAAHTKLTAAQKVASQVTSGQHDNIAALGNVLQGQASAAADTFTGKLRAMGTVIEDHVAQFGEKYGPAVTAAGTAMAGLGAVVSTTSAVMEAARAAALGTRIELIAQEAATKIATAAQWLFNAAMDANPIMLIVIAVAALVAAIVLIATKTTWFQSLWSAFTSFMTSAFNLVKEAALAVFNWIKANWPLLVGILFGPFGLAVAIIVTHFNTIVSVARTVISAITGAFSTVARIISAPFESAVHGVESAVGSIIGVVSRIPGDITRALGNVGGILEHAGEEIIKGLGRGIENALGGVLSTVGGIAGKIASLKGPLDYDYRLLQPAGHAIMGGLQDSIASNLPDLGNLMGTVTQAINVAPSAPSAAAPRGPAVHIDSVVLADELDVDQFMNRVAFKVASSSL